MQTEKIDWHYWHDFFASRSKRPLPDLAKADPHSDLPASLAHSLAIFQLGESGGGSIVEQARQSRIESTRHGYADAMSLFVEEEHRHANILGWCVRVLDGTIIRKNWTARLFVGARRLMGLRLKVLVLLAAEVVGICYYHLLASRLPDCQVRRLLNEIVCDERSHLRFHCVFVRSQVTSPWRRVLFISTWRLTMAAAAVAVLIDHRTALRDLGLDVNTVWRRWMTYSRVAERLVAASIPPTMQPLDASRAACL